MDEFKIYSVSDKYISYLREKFPNVYSNIFLCLHPRILIFRLQEKIK